MLDIRNGKDTPQHRRNLIAPHTHTHSDRYDFEKHFPQDFLRQCAFSAMLYDTPVYIARGPP